MLSGVLISSPNGRLYSWFALSSLGVQPHDAERTSSQQLEKSIGRTDRPT